MKKYFSFSFIIITSGFLLVGSTIYDFSVSKLDGGEQYINDLRGKKILFITLPLQQSSSADLMLYALDTLASAHQTNLKVIATPAIEDGYTGTQQSQLLQWYKSKLGSYVVITDGLYTRKTSASQHPLYKWLTTDSLNNTLDVDVAGPGQKFVVTETGNLVSALLPQTPIGGTAVQRALEIK